MRLGLVTAVLAFLVVGSDVLLDQWITGYASVEFILGTAALIAGICIGLFAIIGALGLAIAAALRDKAVTQRTSKDPASRRTIGLGHAVNAVRENWFLCRIGPRPFRNPLGAIRTLLVHLMTELLAM
jgi:hypothetical protein